MCCSRLHTFLLVHVYVLWQARLVMRGDSWLTLRPSLNASPDCGTLSPASALLRRSRHQLPPGLQLIVFCCCRQQFCSNTMVHLTLPHHSSHGCVSCVLLHAATPCSASYCHPASPQEYILSAHWTLSIQFPQHKCPMRTASGLVISDPN